MDIERIAEGLWRWTARHPDWTPGADWEAEVTSYYVEAEGDVLLIDPLLPSAEGERARFFEALDRDVRRARPPAILLTVYWHERSAGELADRYEGSTVWANDRSLDRLSISVSNPFAIGDSLPGNVEAYDADRRDEVLFWIPAHQALVAGDVLLGDDDEGVRVCPVSWLPEGTDPAEFHDGLRPLLELPIERILLGHGKPVLTDAREALAAILE
jgi:hypothetical protein